MPKKLLLNALAKKITSNPFSATPPASQDDSIPGQKMGDFHLVPTDGSAPVPDSVASASVPAARSEGQVSLSVSAEGVLPHVEAPPLPSGLNLQALHGEAGAAVPAPVPAAPVPVATVASSAEPMLSLPPGVVAPATTTDAVTPAGPSSGPTTTTPVGVSLATDAAVELPVASPAPSAASPAPSAATPAIPAVLVPDAPAASDGGGVVFPQLTLQADQEATELERKVKALEGERRRLHFRRFLPRAAGLVVLALGSVSFAAFQPAVLDNGRPLSASVVSEVPRSGGQAPLPDEVGPMRYFLELGKKCPMDQVTRTKLQAQLAEEYDGLTVHEGIAYWAYACGHDIEAYVDQGFGPWAVERAVIPTSGDVRQPLTRPVMERIFAVTNP